MKIHQNFQTIGQGSITFKAIEKYRYGLEKTVSKHLKISEFSLVKISKILFPAIRYLQRGYEETTMNTKLRTSS